MHFSQTRDIRTDRPTDGRTDGPSYRDARTHLKMHFSRLLTAKISAVRRLGTITTCSVTWEQQSALNGAQIDVFNCPANCFTDTVSNVFEVTVYHKKSSLCWAAIHAGSLQEDTGGTFLITPTNGVATYINTTRNGVVSEALIDSEGEPGGAFLVRPDAIDAASVKKEVLTNEVKISAWEFVNKGARIKREYSKVICQKL